MISLDKIIRSVGRSILYLLLFLACFNFLGRGPVIFLAFSVFGIIANRQRSWNTICALYLFLSTFAIIASLMFYELEETLKCFVFFLSFYAGYCIYNSSLEKETVLNRLLFLGVLGFVANLVFTSYVNFVIIGHVEGNRTLINPWTLDPIAVTLVGLMSSVPLAYSFYCIFCRREIIMKIVGGAFLVLSVWINMQTATRTPFLLAGIVYVIMLYEIRKSIKRNKTRIIVVIVLGYFLIDRLLASVSDSAIADRFANDGVKTSRLDIIMYYMGQMFNYPWGGGFAQKHYYRMAHNVIQETYDNYGFFFFVTLITILLGMLGRIIRLHKRQNKSPFLLMSLAFYLAILIQLMLEPVTAGYPQLLWFLFLIDGIIVGALADRESNLLQKRTI